LALPPERDVVLLAVVRLRLLQEPAVVRPRR